MRLYHKLFPIIILMLGCNLSCIEASITTPKTNAEGSEPEKQEAIRIKGRITFGKESIPSLRRRTTTTSKTRTVALDLPPGVNEIEFDLPDGAKRTFKKQENESKSTNENSYISPDRNYWIGEDENDGSTFDFVRSLDGNVHGSLIDLSDDTVSQLHVDADGLPFVVVTPSSDFPKELSAIPINTRDKDGKDDESPSHRDLMMTRPNSSQMMDDYDSPSVDPISPDNKPSQNRLLQSIDFDDNGKNLDILVVWTKNAECKESNLQKGCAVNSRTKDNMKNLVKLAVAETNHAFRTSNIDTELVLVHSYRHPTYVENESDEYKNIFLNSLYDARNYGDGNMDDIHELRLEHGADLVALIIDGNEQACGIGFVGPSKSWMFSVTDQSCATGYYSFAHEIGHNIGLMHDRGTSDECSSPTYNYGYRDPNAGFRTIMAYDCVSGQCDNNRGGSCTRIAKFSSPNILHNGKPLGIAGKVDSVRFINERRVEVARYFPHKNSECKFNESMLEVVVKTDANPNQTSWVLKQNNIEIDSISSYSQPNSIVTHKKCVGAGACYMFTLEDKGGDGIKNGGYVKIFEAGKTVLEVLRFNTPNSSSESWAIAVEGTMEHNIGFPSDISNQSCDWLSQQCSIKRNQECSKANIKNVCVDVCNMCEALQPLKCDWDESLLEITIKTDDHPEETSWILKQKDKVIDSKSSYTQPNAVVKYETCVEAGSCYNFIIQDTGRDGIENGFFKITEAGETVVDFTDVRSSSAQYSIPVEGTVRHKIGWPGQSKVQCKWLKTQIVWKRNTECARWYIKNVCPNVCGTCN